jgi:zinc ribbon protein
MAGKYCSSCGGPLRPGAAFCPKCGASVVGSTVAGESKSVAQSTPPVAPPQPVGHVGRNVGIVIVIIIIIILIVAVLALVPVPLKVSYSFSIDNPGSVSATYYTSKSLCPAGASASVTFTVVSGDTVTFSVLDPNGMTVWSDDSSSGSTTFTVQNCGTYQFGAYDWSPETVDISVSVASASPIL